jgi:hypothetical protein
MLTANAWQNYRTRRQGIGRGVAGFLGLMRCAVVLAFLGAATTVLCAQEQTAIVGTVTDATGSVLPGVHITITNEATGQSRTLDSNNSGDYAAPSLAIGTYTVKATSPKFKEYVETGISLTVGATVRADIRMNLGSTTETVSVSAETEQVQSDTSEVSNLISSKEISNLDINGRDILSLLTLGAGVTTTAPDFQVPTAVTASFVYAFNGMSASDNVWLIDGGEAYDRGAGGTMNVLPSPDAISEFKVLSSNYSPDYGFGSGGIITMVLKSGTQHFHGALWEYFRNNDLDANNYFANLYQTPTPELRFNTFGGNLGGPIPFPGRTGRPKTFFFVNEEERRIVLGAQFNGIVPTIPERSGDFSAAAPIYVPSNIGDPAKLAQYASLGLVPGQQFPGNQIPASLLDPNFQLLLGTGAIPLPTSGDEYSAPANTTVNLREDVVRIDHTVNDKIQLMGHYLHDGFQELVPGEFGGYPTVSFPVADPSYNAVIKMTYIFRPNLLNEASFNYNGNKIIGGISGIYHEPAGWDVNKLFPGNDPNERMPVTIIGAPFGASYIPGPLPYTNGATDFQERDDVSWAKGPHNFKFGGSFMRYAKSQDFIAFTNGEDIALGIYTAQYSSTGQLLAPGNSFADMLMGLETAYTEAESKPRLHARANFGDVYFMDNWRVDRRLTLNLGVRYELLPHSYEAFNRVSNFVASDYINANAAVFNSDGSISSSSPGVGTVSGVPLSNVPFYLNGIVLAGRNGVPRGLVNNHWDTVEPRVGFAYDLLGTGKTILRAGVGIFFNQIQGGDLYNATPNPPFTNTPSLTSVYFSNPGLSTINGQSIPAFPILPQSLTNLAPNYDIPETAQWNFGIQQQLNGKSIFSLAYVGNAGWHEWLQRAIDTVPLSDSNRAAIVAGAYNPNLDRIYRGYSGITQQETTGISRYASLQANLRVESAHGTAQLAYTWAHALDINSLETQIGAAVTNPFNLRADYGSSDLDIRNTFVASYIYPIPTPHAWSNAFARQLLGGWQISGITSIQSGLPFSVPLGYDNIGVGGGTTSRADIVAPVSYPQTRLQWFSTSSFAAPPLLTFGDSGRNILRLPGRDVWNIALFKTFPLHESMKLQFRADSYNTFNHTQFNQVDGGFSDALFGQVTSTYDPRVLQLSLRFGF